jgi:hypothetical protein
MVQTATPVAAGAERILDSRLRPIGDPTKYTCKHDTARGRRLMLKRQVNFIGVFAEIYPGNGAIAGVTLNVHKLTPGHYGAGDRRASSIAADEKLGLGNEAFYIRCDSETALDRYIDWYNLQ